MTRRPLFSTATAIAEGRVEAAELLQRDLADLIRRRPDIEVIIYRNLAVGLGETLIRSGNSLREQGPAASEVLHLATPPGPTSA